MHGGQVSRFSIPLLALGVTAMACVTGESSDVEASGEDPTPASGAAAASAGSTPLGGAATGSAPLASNGGVGGALPLGGAPGGGISSVAGAANTGGSSSVSTKRCKRGIGAGQPSLVSSALPAGIAWWYNWAVSRQAVSPGVEFVPMIWGEAALENAAAQMPAEAHYLLGFNEPNFFAQSNLSAQSAAALWPQVEAVAKAKNLELVSPAVNYCGDDQAKSGPCHDTNPVSYLEAFFDACQGCRVDYVALHWYNCSVPELKFFLGQFRRFNRPIWLTEFACAYGGDTSVAGQEAYLRAAVPVLEADERVFRYAWFSGSEQLPASRLVEADGELTPLGKVYASLPRGASCAD
jgi:hypothetical protein